MAEELLDRPEVGAAFQQMRRERVAQPVRMRGEAAERARVEPPAADGEEQRVLGAAGEHRARVAQVLRSPERRLLAERDDALLAALAAANVDQLLLEVDVGEIEADRLGAAEPGGVDDLDERAVAQRDRPLALEREELRLDLLLARRIGEPAADPRRERCIGNARRAERVAEESAHRGELARDRRRREPARRAPRTRRAQERRVLGEDADVDVVERRPARVEPAAELVDVDPVRATCPVRERRRVEEARGGGVGVHPNWIRHPRPAASAGPGSVAA